jgi:hypothetical protein
MKELHKTSDNIIIALLGNKCDLEDKWPRRFYLGGVHNSIPPSNSN